MLMLVATIIQEHQLWTQMLKFGRELQFMTVRFMVRNSIKEMLMIFKLMVILKKLLLIQDSHMHQL